MHVYSTLSVLLPQAPRECKWCDVEHLLTGAGNKQFRLFASDLNVKPVVVDEVLVQGEYFDPMCIAIIRKDWKSRVLHPRHDDEGIVRPIVHGFLQCAAFAAEMLSATTGPSREFLILAEPSVEANRTDRLSDESIVEIVTDGTFFRILVEVKGSNVIKSDSCKIEIPCRPFCQLIQQVALALKSGKWKNKLLAALSTGKVWLFFEITDASDDCGNLQLRVEHSYSTVLEDHPSTETMQLCLSFMVRHLCS